MRHRFAGAWSALCAVAVIAAAGCGDGGSGPGPAIIPAELVGTWESGLGCRPNCGLTLTSVANPADTLNVTQATALSTEIQIRSDGRFTLAFVPAGVDGPQIGNARVEGNLLLVTDTRGVVDTLEYVVTASMLDLRFRRQFTAFDFTGDGVPDPARARLISVRR